MLQKRDETSRNFNVPTSFCTLLTNLELPYKRAFVFGREMELSTLPKCADSNFGSTLVHNSKFSQKILKYLQVLQKISTNFIQMLSIVKQNLFNFFQNLLKHY